MGIDVDFGFQLFINIAVGQQGMDIKTYVHSQKPFIDIGFWGIDVVFVFSIVYQHCKVQGMGIKTYINVLCRF